MNRIAVDQYNEIKSTAIISNKDSIKHIKEVLKKDSLDLINILIPNIGLSKAKILEISSYCELEVLSLSPGKEPFINLYCALARPHTCQKIVEYGSSLGVKKFHFFHGDKSEKSFANSKFFKNKIYDNYAIKGLEQSKVYYKLPQFFINEQLPKTPKGKTLFLDPQGATSIKNTKIDCSTELHFFLGPEGGWSNSEIERFKESGFTGVKVSDSILRMETALIYFMAQLELQTQL